jgi:hypothetical protein
LKTKDEDKNRIGTAVEIKPVSFRPGRPDRGLKSTSRTRWIISTALTLILILLCTSAWFVFTARQVVIRIEPQPSRISIQGTMAAPKFGDHYLLRPGEYRLQAERQCFRLLDEGFTVTDEKNKSDKHQRPIWQ